MLFGELVTLIQNKLPVKVIVFNNSSLNFVELEMKAAGFVTFGTDLTNPDFAALAESGLYHVRRDAFSGQRGANRLIDLVEHFGRVSVRVLAANSHAPRAVEQEKRVVMCADWHPGL